MHKEKQKYTVLNKNFQFQNVYRKGLSYISPLVVAYVLPRATGQIRYGITTSKKIGCAVERNRARRVIKAALYDLLPKIDGGYDLVFVARKATVVSKSTKVYSELYKHFNRAGIVE